jgi:aryl-alcohol dehydrogenase-like predicted oxidoreductase
MTFGGQGYFGAVGNTQEGEAERLVGAAMDAGVNLFDTADVYSAGRSEILLGQALGARRPDVVIATKCAMRAGDGDDQIGLSRRHIVRSCEASLKRLGTDYIDLYLAHGHDALTPMEETLRAFDDLVRDGKVRYIGECNHSGWHAMKAVALSDKLNLNRYVAQQVMYSLMVRDAEYELVPMGLEQGLGMMVFSPLSAGLLSGKYRRGSTPPSGTRLTDGAMPIYADLEKLYRIVDALDEVAAQHEAAPTQVALAWTMRKPGVSTVLFGARDETQLAENLRAADLTLTAEQMQRLDAASEIVPPYPYWHQRSFGAEINPPIPPVDDRPRPQSPGMAAARTRLASK